MAFQSFSFLAFFLIAAPCCVALCRAKPAWGHAALLLSCVLFGLLGDAKGLGVLAVGLCVSFCLSRQLTKSRFLLGVGYHIVVLLVFKYTTFVTGGAVVIPWVPTGLSFFTFSQIWYLKAVYEGQSAPASLQSFSLYSLFFPTVVSGPILAPKDFFPQLDTDAFLRPTGDDIARGFYTFGCGFVKKVLFADQLALLVAQGYAAPQNLSYMASWLVILAFTLQLYLDFSGYCDMATGLAGMLGIVLPRNFHSPYRATSIGDFWKRWHITLTTFLRQCVYLPLGGNRRGAVRTYVHILIVFLLSGLWHGAGWTFLVWGALHGLGQIVERLCAGKFTVPKPIAWALTFGFVNIAWVFFRAPSLSSALALLKSAVTFTSNILGGSNLAHGLYATEVSALWTLFPAIPWHLCAMGGLFAVSLTIAFWPRNTVTTVNAMTLRWYHGVALGLLLGWSLLSTGGTATFIYANF